MTDTTQRRFGFVNFAETWNGRLAMLGFVIGLGTELLTGQGILNQLGFLAWLAWTRVGLSRPGPDRVFDPGRISLSRSSPGMAIVGFSQSTSHSSEAFAVSAP